MLISDRISQDLRQAMLAKENLRVSTLRLVKAALDLDSKNRQVILTDSDTIKILQKLSKQRQECIELFARGNRQDLVDKETNELKIIENYLPSQLTEVEILLVIREVLDENPGMAQGILMKNIMGKLKGKNFDGKLVNQLLLSEISVKS